MIVSESHLIDYWLCTYFGASQFIRPSFYLSIYLSTDSLFLLQINLDSFQIIGGGTLSRKMLVTRVVPKIIIITLLLLFDAILFLMRCMAATAKGYV